MGDETKRRILARRAGFVAATLALTVPIAARAADASTDDAAETDADAAPPEPCLSIAKEPEPQPEPCLCSMAPPEVALSVEPALLVAALTMLSRRRRR